MTATLLPYTTQGSAELLAACSLRPIRFRSASRGVRVTSPLSDPAIQVRPIQSKQTRNDFIRLPHAIYSADPQWVAPLESEVQSFIDHHRHPFYRHGQAEQFVAYRDGRPVGRIQASDDPHYNAQHSANAGHFGLFECVDDQRVSNALFDAAADWLRARGRSQIIGPVDYSTNYPCGLLIHGFETPPRVMMNHHPAYYAELCTGWGFSKAKDLCAWWFDDQLNVLDQWRNTAERLARRAGVTIRPVNFRDFDAEVDRCQEVYNRVWEEHWGAVRMTRDEFVHLAHQLKQFARPEMVLLAEVAGQPVGISMTLPDLNEAIRPTGGRLTTWGVPLGLARLAWGLRRIRTARMAVLGVLDGYRRRGIAELLILRTLDYGKHVLGYTGAELSWTLEDNVLINRTIESVGGKRYKAYRIYERSLDGIAPPYGSRRPRGGAE